MKKSLFATLLLLALASGCAKQEVAPVTQEPASQSQQEAQAEAAKADAMVKVGLDIKAPEPTKTTTDSKVAVKAAPTPAAKSFSITAKQWEFSPATITVNKGDKVTLSIKSIDVAHGFFLDEFGVSKTLAPGATTTVSFTADKAGSFSFLCSVMCGKGHGAMKGTLIVK